MNITLRTPELDLAITDATHEEALDTLALLINTGVIPAEEDFDIYEEDEEDECCGDTVGFCGCDCENKEPELSQEEEEVVEFLQGLENILAHVLAEAEEKEKKEEKKEEMPAELEQLFNIFLRPFIKQ